MRRSRTLRGALAALAFAALAGCVQSGPPLGPTVMVPGARFNDVQGQADTVVRAFAAGPDGETREIGGAVCDVGTILYSARLVTPARLVVPSFGPQSPTIVVSCAAGEWRGAAEKEISVLWVRAPGDWGGPGPWGGFYGGGPWGWDSWGGRSSFPRFVYRDINVMMH